MPEISCSTIAPARLVRLVYKLKTDGSSFGILHVFGCNDFCAQQELILARDGFLYGNAPAGTSPAVFKIKPDGTSFSVVVSRPDCTEGCIDYFSSAIIQGVDGAFYGIKSSGDDFVSGAVYRLVASADTQGMAAGSDFDDSIIFVDLSKSDNHLAGFSERH